jgi:serine/threonine protein kinase
VIPKLPRGFSQAVKIGSGGFGDVFRARQIALDRLVAIKFIHDKNASSRSALKREASMQAGLHIPGIPQIYDVMEFSKQVCIVMQWVNGVDLRTFLNQDVSYQDKISLAGEIISVTAQLHSKGYAHRDIKPENILVSSDGVFLIDFGLTCNGIDDKLEKKEIEIKGTPAYIAPELWQGRGKLTDQRCSDVFSLGKVISEMFGSSEMPSCVQNALSQDPDKRYSSASAFLVDWRENQFVEQSNWREIAGAVSNEMLSRQLLTGSYQFLHQGKNEEAYQLLVESIQLNPDNPDALQFVDQFPLVNKSGRKKTYATAILICLATLLLFLMPLMFISKKHSTISKPTITHSGHENKALFISSNVPNSRDYDKKLPFKELPVNLKTLSGRLKIAGHPAQGQFILDGNEMQLDTNYLTFALPSINHTGLWRSSDQNVIWKEVVMILPFEEKRIWIKAQ